MNKITQAMALLSDCFAEANTSEEPMVSIKFNDTRDKHYFDAYLKHQFEQQYMVFDPTMKQEGMKIHGIKVFVHD